MKTLAVVSAAFALSIPLHLASQSIQTDRPILGLETVATFTGPMPTGVTVSRRGRIFVNFPRWGDDVPFTVAELVNGKAVAFPDAGINDWPGRNLANPNAYKDELVTRRTSSMFNLLLWTRMTGCGLSIPVRLSLKLRCLVAPNSYVSIWLRTKSFERFFCPGYSWHE